MNVVNNLVTFATCRVRPHPNPLRMVILDSPSLGLYYLCFSVRREDVTCPFSLVTSRISRSESTPDPRPIFMEEVTGTLQRVSMWP